MCDLCLEDVDVITQEQILGGWTAIFKMISILNVLRSLDNQVQELQ